MADKILENGLVEELGLKDLSAEEQAKLIDTATETLQARISMRVMDLLTEEDKAEVDKMTDDEAKMQEFLADRIPNVDEIATEEYAKLISELKAGKEQILALIKK